MSTVQVSLVGFRGEPCVPIVRNDPKIRQHLLSPPTWTRRIPRTFFLLYAPFKVLLQIMTLLWTLVVTIPRPDVFLIQNPPSIPTFLVVFMAAWLRGCCGR